MIISHRHKFIFVKTSKTAGTSIEIALSAICGPKDIITPLAHADEKYRKSLGIPSAQNYHYSLPQYTKTDWLKFLYYKKLQGFYNHIPALEIREHVEADIWNNYYKFCFERNPYDKVISWYYYWYNENYPPILHFIKSGLAGQVRGFNLYTDPGGIPIVDKIYQFESIPTAFRDIEQRVGLQKNSLQLPPKKTKGKSRKDKRHYSQILSPEEAAWISKIFAREIKYFGYSFEEK